MSKALISILFAVAACGGKSTPATTTPEGGGGGGGGGAGAAVDAKAQCVTVMNKNKECTSDFIPALVDVRAKYNNPAGVADAVKADRNAVISQAMTEWATDSKDEGIAATCDKIEASPPTDADAALATECLAKADCAAYVACIMPQFEKRFAK